MLWCLFKVNGASSSIILFYVGSSLAFTEWHIQKFQCFIQVKNVDFYFKWTCSELSEEFLVIQVMPCRNVTLFLADICSVRRMKPWLGSQSRTEKMKQWTCILETTWTCIFVYCMAIWSLCRMNCAELLSILATISREDEGTVQCMLWIYLLKYAFKLQVLLLEKYRLFVILLNLKKVQCLETRGVCLLAELK